MEIMEHRSFILAILLASSHKESNSALLPSPPFRLSRSLRMVANSSASFTKMDAVGSDQAAETSATVKKRDKV